MAVSEEVPVPPIEGQVVDILGEPVAGASVTEYIVWWYGRAQRDHEEPTEKIHWSQRAGSTVKELTAAQTDSEGRFNLETHGPLSRFEPNWEELVNNQDGGNGQVLANGLVVLLARKPGNSSDESTIRGPWFGTERVFLRELANRAADAVPVEMTVEINKRSVFSEDVGPGKLDVTIWFEVTAPEQNAFDLYIEARNGPQFGPDETSFAQAKEVGSRGGQLRRGLLSISVPESVEAASQKRNRWERSVPLRTTSGPGPMAASLATSHALSREIPPHSFFHGWGYSATNHCRPTLNDQTNGDTEVTIDRFELFSGLLTGIAGAAHKTIGALTDIYTFSVSTGELLSAAILAKPGSDRVGYVVGNIGGDTTRSPNPNRMDTIEMSWRQPLSHALYRLPVNLPDSYESTTPNRAIEIIPTGVLHLRPTENPDEEGTEPDVIQLGHPFELNPNLVTPNN